MLHCSNIILKYSKMWNPKTSTVVIAVIMTTAYYMIFLPMWILERKPITLKTIETRLVETELDFANRSYVLFQKQLEEVNVESQPRNQDTSKPTSSDNICEKWKNDLDWKMSSIKPLITLDPKRILYTAIVNGPSNEMMGFQEAIFVAIKTNRSFAVPPFKPHFKDKDRGTQGLVPAEMRVDMNMVSRLISVVNIEDMQQKCDSRFDIGFQTKKVSCGFDKYVYKTCGMSMESRYSSFLRNDIGYEAIRYRKDKNCTASEFRVRHIPVAGMHPDMVQSKYKSNLPCAVMINTYKSLLRPSTNIDRKLLEKAKLNPTILTSKSLEQASSETIIKLIEIFTQRPRYVRDIAQQFAGEIMKSSKYIVLHWRYNKEWKFSYCDPDRTKLQFCEKLEAIKPSDLASAIVLLGKNFTESKNPNFFAAKCKKISVVNVYLAFATDDYEEVKKQSSDKYFQNSFLTKVFSPGQSVKHAFRFNNANKCWKIQVFNKADLLHFLMKKYPREICSIIWRDTHELVSLVENELCRRSEVFAYSPSSSWSIVALQTRSNNNTLTNIPIWDVLSEVDKIT